MSKTLAPEAANMARSKFEELKKLIEQRQQINVELIGRLAKALEKVKAGVAAAGVSSAPPAAASKQAAAKRSSQPPGLTAPDPKRPKLDSETDKKIQDIWRMCATVLDFLWKKKNSLVFQRPVDPIRDGVPDYFKFISHPMDLGTIKAKLKERGYNDPREFAADVRLVWRNCATYNQLNTPVRTMGDQLSEDWERKWAELKVEQRWDELLATRDPQTISLDRRIASSARQLLQRVSSVHVLPDVDPSRPMTTVEKRKLSIALSELQGNQLAEVLNIIAESLKDINPDDDDEIELDVDQLDNPTLWRLREYCDNVNTKHNTKTTAPPKAGGGGAPRSVHDNGRQQQHSSKPPTRTESGSESDRYSAEQDVKGSNMVEQPQSNGVRLTGQALLQAGNDQGDRDVALGKDNTETAAVNGTCTDLGSVRVEEVVQMEQVDKAEPAEDAMEEADEKADDEVAEETAEEEAAEEVAAEEETAEEEAAEEEAAEEEAAEEEAAEEEAAEEVAAEEVAAEEVAAEEVARADGAGQEGGDGEMGQDEEDGGKDPEGMEVDGEETRGAVAIATYTAQPSETEAGVTSGGVEAPTLEAAEEGQPNFVKNQRTAIPVDESATAPKDKSAIATDKKSNKDVVLNASAWQAEEDPAEGGGEATETGAGGEEEGDDLWDSFRSVAEREKQQKAEEEKRRKDLEQERERERLRVVAEARQAKEEEERKMREAEEAAAAEAKRAKDEARQKELEELQMQANTAQVYQPPDAKAFGGALSGADINDLGLMYKHDDDADVGFDD